jgi:hypothetical protein
MNTLYSVDGTINVAQTSDRYSSWTNSAAGFLEPLGLTQAELARALAIPLNRVNELVRGKRGVTPKTALLLAGYFKTPPNFG